MDIFGRSGLVGSFDRDEGDRADFGEDHDEACEQVGFHTGLAAISLPVVILRCFDRLLIKFDGLRGCGIKWLVPAMEKSDGVGDSRNECSHRKSIIADVDALLPLEVVGKTVGLIESQRELTLGDPQADVAQIAKGRDVMMSDLVDVEGKLGLNVLMLAFGIVYDEPYFAASAGNSMGTARLVASGWPTESPM